jgi:hypothetical protein
MAALLATTGAWWLKRPLVLQYVPGAASKLGGHNFAIAEIDVSISIVRDLVQVSIIGHYMATVEVDLTPVLESSQRLTAFRGRKLGLGSRLQRLLRRPIEQMQPVLVELDPHGFIGPQPHVRWHAGDDDRVSQEHVHVGDIARRFHRIDTARYRSGRFLRVQQDCAMPRAEDD